MTELARLEQMDELAAARADLARLRERTDAWRREYAEPVIMAVRAGEEPPSTQAGKALFDPVREALAVEQRDLRLARDVARDELDDTATLVTAMFTVSGLLILVAVVAAGAVLRNVILRPIERLADDVRAVARGAFDHPVTPTGPRELAELGTDVEAMRERIVAEVAALRDAERALLEQARELQRSNQELEQFAYVASHDLQEPLRKVASFTQMLERRYKGQLDERADRYIAFAVDGAKRMQELINDLLEFSRVGRLDTTREPVDAGELVAHARSRLGAALEESGGEVVADGLPVVSGDPGLLTAVFQNLIANAVKFRGDEPPRVVVAAERDGALLALHGAPTTGSASRTSTPSASSSSSSACTRATPTRARGSGSRCAARSSSTTAAASGSRPASPVAAPASSSRFPPPTPRRRPHHEPAAEAWRSSTSCSSRTTPATSC